MGIIPGCLGESSVVRPVGGLGQEPNRQSKPRYLLRYPLRQGYEGQESYGGQVRNAACLWGAYLYHWSPTTRRDFQYFRNCSVMESTKAERRLQTTLPSPPHIRSRLRKSWGWKCLPIALFFLKGLSWNSQREIARWSHRGIRKRPSPW